MITSNCGRIGPFRWVNKGVARAHGPGFSFDLLGSCVLETPGAANQLMLDLRLICIDLRSWLAAKIKPTEPELAPGGVLMHHVDGKVHLDLRALFAALEQDMEEAPSCSGRGVPPGAIGLN